MLTQNFSQQTLLCLVKEMSQRPRACACVSMSVHLNACSYCVQREITRKLTFPKQPTNPFLEMVKFLLERIAPVHIDSEAIRSENMDSVQLNQSLHSVVSQC